MSLALLFAASVYARPLEVSDGEVFLDSVMSIQEVSVVGKKHAEIIKPQTLSGVQLSRLNSQTVADALRYFSGVQLKDYGGIGGIKTVNIRSMGTNHVGVFYNGIQLGNAQNGQVDLGRYSLDNIEEISLYNGQKSNIFQSAKDFASSSAIYIYTKRPTFAPGKNYQVMVQMKTGSFGLANPSVVWNQRLSDNVTMSANAEYTYANGKYKFHYRRLQLNGDVAYDTTATRQNGDVEAVRAELGVYGRLRDGRWNINGYFYTSQRGIPGAIVNNVFRRGERQWDKSAFGQGAFEKKFSNVYSLKISGKFAWDYSRYLRDDEKELYLNNHYYQKEVYVSVANLFAITDWWNVSASADLQWNAMDADLVDFAYPTRWTELGAIATAVTLGRFNAQASLLGTFIQESTRSRKAYTAGPNRHELSPAVFVNYSPFDSDWFDDVNNHVIKLSTLTENTLWQVFSVYHIPTTSDYLQTEFSSDTEFLEFVNMLKDRSQYDFNVEFSETDKILTLSTCYNDEERVVLHAKLIKKEVREHEKMAFFAAGRAAAAGNGFLQRQGGPAGRDHAIGRDRRELREQRRARLRAAGRGLRGRERRAPGLQHPGAERPLRLSVCREGLLRPGRPRGIPPQHQAQRNLQYQYQNHRLHNRDGRLVEQRAGHLLGRIRPDCARLLVGD